VLFDYKTGYPTTPFDISAWENILNEDNAIIVEIGWKNTYPISDFIADPVKKAEIEAAIKKYIALNKVEMIEVN